MTEHKSYLIMQKQRTSSIFTLKTFLNLLNKESKGCDGGFDFQFYQLSQKGMEILLQHLKQSAKLNRQSMFLDVGSGRGNTVFCVAHELNPVLSYGIEGDKDRFKVRNKLYKQNFINKLF
jgi:tRNA/tmRNA/rRNA uracil-C5-methylase (TrmA/RlmC/RlmD family)